jgi:hypothetical protein
VLKENKRMHSERAKKGPTGTEVASHSAKKMKVNLYSAQKEMSLTTVITSTLIIHVLL